MAMTERLTELLAHLFSFDITLDLLRRDFVQQALLAAALLALVSGLIGPFIVMRQMSFAVHGSSELSLTGAAFALLAGFNVGVGALVGCALAAVLFGILGQRARERDSAIGVVLAFGLGMAVLFIHLYPGRTGTSFRPADGPDRRRRLLGTGAVGCGVGGRHRGAGGVLPPAAVRHRRSRSGGRTRSSGAGVGHCVRRTRRGHRRTGRADRRGTAGDVAADHARGRRGTGVLSPAAAIAASVIFAEVSAVGGILLSLAPGVPVSVFVTTISFAIFLLCWLVGRRGSHPRSTGRVDSEDHSDHEPGYNAASTPAAASAATTTEAVTPDPQ